MERAFPPEGAWPSLDSVTRRLAGVPDSGQNRLPDDLDELLSAHRELKTTRSAPGQPGALLFPHAEADEIRRNAETITRAVGAAAATRILEEKERHELALIPRNERPRSKCPLCSAGVPDLCSDHSSLSRMERR